MDEHLSNLDLVEMGRRFAAIRKHLGLSQTDVANEIGLVFRRPMWLMRLAPFRLLSPR